MSTEGEAAHGPQHPCATLTSEQVYAREPHCILDHSARVLVPGTRMSLKLLDEAWSDEPIFLCYKLFERLLYTTVTTLSVLLFVAVRAYKCV